MLVCVQVCILHWKMHSTVKMAIITNCILLITMSLVTVTVADCDNPIVRDLTFRLGGNNLNWPCHATQNIYTNSGRYIPKNIIATRSQIYRDSAFVAIPRYRNGVPFTLGRVDLRKGKCSVPIAPYPCMESQEEGNCQALQNVVDIFLDRQVCIFSLFTICLGQPKINLFTTSLSVHVYVFFSFIFTEHSLGTRYWYREQFSTANKAMCTESRSN